MEFELCEAVCDVSKLRTEQAAFPPHHNKSLELSRWRSVVEKRMEP